MRALELVLVLLCMAVTIRLASGPRNTAWDAAALWLLAAVLLIQIVSEGWRWQIAPAYAATVVVLMASPALGSFGVQTLFWSNVASIGLLAIAGTFCLALPFVQPPPPHGPYHVGVTALQVDVSRPPNLLEDELQAAPLVRLWYPATPPVAALTSKLHTYLKSRIENRLRAEPIPRAVADAPVATQRTQFPVLVYFDGWPEDRINNVNLIVELVSHGFAVASLQYPATAPGMSDAAAAALRAHLARDMVSYSSDVEFGRSVELTHARARIHAQDAVTVLDTLASLDSDPESRFAHRLDTRNAGTLGFSFGGGIAAEASRLDPRIKAVVNMDGRHWGDSLHEGVERPYMLIGEELTMPTAADLTSSNPATRYEAILDQVDYSNLDANMRALGGIRISIAGTAHMNFTDVPLRSPLRRFSYGGTINPQRAQEIIHGYIVDFFSRCLLSNERGPLESPRRHYPEARVQIWTAAVRSP